MTKQEKIIVSAYTGVLMCDFHEMQGYIEQKLGHPVWTHELANKQTWEKIKEASKEDFIEICKKEEDLVRCKDCKYRGRETHFCFFTRDIMPDLFYCALGTKKEES